MNTFRELLLLKYPELKARTRKRKVRLSDAL